MQFNNLSLAWMRPYILRPCHLRVGIAIPVANISLCINTYLPFTTMLTHRRRPTVCLHTLGNIPLPQRCSKPLVDLCEQAPRSSARGGLECAVLAIAPAIGRYNGFTVIIHHVTTARDYAIAHLRDLHVGNTTQLNGPCSAGNHASNSSVRTSLRSVGSGPNG